jgi:putative membrane protein
MRSEPEGGGTESPPDAPPAPEPAVPPSGERPAAGAAAAPGAGVGAGAEAAAGARHRLHPVSILFILGAQARSLLVPGLFVLFAARRSDDPSVWAMVLIVPYALAAVVRFLSFRYAYLPDELVIESGFVFRKRRHIPYGRIHNIASVENPLHRAFGVAEVRVETAGGEEPEARIRVLSLEALGEMRRRVAAAKARGTAGAAAAAAGAEVAAAAAGAAAARAGQGAAAAGEGEAALPARAPAATAAPAARTLVRLGVKDLVLHGLIDNRGMVVAGALVGLAWQAGLFDRAGLGGGRPRGGWEGWGGGWEAWGELPARVWELVWGPLRDGASPLRVALGALLALALFLVFVRLLSIAWAFYKLWGFRLVLAGRELASESGLLTRMRTALPLHRIQTVTVTETPLHRLLRRVEVGAETAGGKGGAREGKGGDRERQRLAPVLRRDALPALLAEVLPGLDLAAVEWRPVDPRAERRMRRARLAVAAVLGAAAALAVGAAGGSPWWGLAVFAPLALLGIWIARRRSRLLAWAVTPDAVLYRSGGLWRHLTVARSSKVQAVGLVEGPFDRRWGMATLALDTAGASMTSHRLHVPYLARATARDLFDLCERRAAATAFRW